VTTVTYLHTDALGSPVARTNASRALVESTEYAPYGAPINRPVDGVGYTGHVMDQSSGLIYMQQRYYDPQSGRFLSIDSVGIQKGAVNFNRYWYAAANPFKNIDPDGRYVCSKTKTTKEECDQFEKSYNAIETAAKDENNDKSVRDLLNAVLKLLGKPHTMNGVTLKGFGAARTALAATGKYSNGTTIKFNPTALEKSMQGLNEAQRTNFVASVMVHEARHGLDEENNFDKTFEFDVALARERFALRGEAFFALGSNQNLMGLLKNGRVDNSAIETQAMDSARSWCASSAAQGAPCF
jgi:RHS repeat-associated protein